MIPSVLKLILIINNKVCLTWSECMLCYTWDGSEDSLWTDGSGQWCCLACLCWCDEETRQRWCNQHLHQCEHQYPVVPWEALWSRNSFVTSYNSIIFKNIWSYLLLKRTVGAVADAFLPSLNSLMNTSLRMMSLASLKMVEKMTVTLSALASTYMVSSSL